MSDTHDKLKCKFCTISVEAEQEAQPLGEAQVKFVDEFIGWMKDMPCAASFLGATIGSSAMEVAPAEPDAKLKVKVVDIASIQRKLHSGGYFLLTE